MQLRTQPSNRIPVLSKLCGLPALLLISERQRRTQTMKQGHRYNQQTIPIGAGEPFRVIQYGQINTAGVLCGALEYHWTRFSLNRD